jgi:hypothetical protein
VSQIGIVTLLFVRSAFSPMVMPTNRWCC